MSTPEQTIVDALRANEGRLSRGALANKTGLTKEVVASAVAALIERDEARVERGQGGVVCYLGERTDDERRILQYLRRPDLHNAAALNSLIRSECKIPYDAFFVARDHLLELDLVWRDRGQGGKSGYNGRGGHAIEALTEATVSLPMAVDYAVERSLYAPLRKSLGDYWFQGTQRYWVEDSSSLGSMKTGGAWTRPDLTALTFDRHALLPGVFWEVYSFEVKKPGDCTVVGLHEALAHARFVTRPYAIFVTAGNETDKEVYDWTREANRLNVGLIVVHDVEPTEANFIAWKFLADPSRHLADPVSINDKLKQLMEPRCGEIEKALAELSKHP